jgi:menaquinone-specific isochorismate synthase
MTSLFNFLQEGSQYPKVFWKSRGNRAAFAGYGAASGVEKNSSLTFGGQAFSSHSCKGIWSSFPSSFFFSPTSLRQADWDPSKLPFALPKLLHRKDAPSFDKWWMMVNDALEKIQKEQFRKVVFARQTTLTFSGKIDPYQVLKMLSPMGAQASLFLLQFDADTTFLGASPEKLFHRQERKIFSEALAGTKDKLEEWTAKESSEVEAVQVFLHDKFLKCCRDIQWNPLEQKSFGTLTHLYQSIRGELKEEISDQELLLHLHPTPALGGLPKQVAMTYLAEMEPFSRGWYGGPFGMLSPQETDMAVAIRSALIRGNEMHLFAGTGIVKGSEPKKEWEELDRKIAHYMRVIHE